MIETWIGTRPPKSADVVNKAREAILALKPVTFRYKPEIDPEKVPQFGVVAERVEKVNPDLVVHDHNRKPLTVRCEAVMRCCLMSSMRA